MWFASSSGDSDINWDCRLSCLEEEEIRDSWSLCRPWKDEPRELCRDGGNEKFCIWTLKEPYVVFKEEIQTQNCNIYDINEVTKLRYIYFFHNWINKLLS